MTKKSNRASFLIAGMLICACAGFGFAWSVFQLPFIQNFGWSTADVSLTFTFQIIATALVPAFTNKLLKYIKTRYAIFIGSLIFGISVIGTGYVQTLGQLYLTGGIGTGLGIGILYPNITAMSVKFFPDKRGLVAGLLAASFGSGVIIWAPISVRLMELYGLLTTYKILGVIFLAVVSLLSLRITDAPSANVSEAVSNGDEHHSKNLPVDRTRKEMIKSPKYYLIVAIFAIGSTSGLMIMGHASPIVQDTFKISSSTAAIVVGLIAIANTSGRLFWGWLSDRIGRYTAITMLFLIITLSMVVMATVSQIHLFVTMILIIGLCYGGFAALLAPLTADTFGIKYLNENYGLMYFAFGVGGILGPRLAAIARDQSHGEYTWAFIIAAILSSLGAVLSVSTSRKKAIYH